jgi:uncharacterized damage-inducible protein DinB
MKCIGLFASLLPENRRYAERKKGVAVTSLSLFYSGWPAYQSRLITAIAPLTDEQLALRNSPDTWTVGQIAAHILATRVWWFHTRIGGNHSELADLECWDFKNAPVRTAAELTNGLEKTWHMIQEALDYWTVNDFFKIFPVHEEDQTERTVQWIIWHTLEHDIHHGGEISSILGAHGLVAVVLE